MKQRIVITGLGIVAPNGIGKNNFWNTIKEGRSGIDSISKFNVKKYPIRMGGEVKNFEPKKMLDEKTLSRTARFTHFGLVSAIEAVKDSFLEKGDCESERMGVAMGTAAGGIDFAVQQVETFIKDGPLAMNSFGAAIFPPSACTRAIALAFGLKGPCITFSSVCTASTDAIGFGFNQIREGKVDLMVVGGTEAPFAPSIFAGFCLSRLLSQNNKLPPESPKPFDLNRDGTVLAEGGTVLILEKLEHALKRKTHIYAEVVGFASTFDAYHIVNPDPAGTQGIRVLKMALEDANVKPEEVDYINAHGTGTVKNDKVETLIIKEVFKDYAYKIPVSSTKSMTGHLLGAAGAVETAICALAIENNTVPPTINYETEDPECDLDYVPNQAIKKELNVVVKNSFGIGGQNSVLVFKKFVC